MCDYRYYITVINNFQQLWMLNKNFLSVYNILYREDLSMYNIDYKAMGQRIKARRKEKKLTQEELAEIIEIGPSHIGEIERGTSVCSLAVLVNIATVLELNLDTLIKGINDENADRAFSELLETVSKDKQELYIRLCENIADTLK